MKEVTGQELWEELDRRCKLLHEELRKDLSDNPDYLTTDAKITVDQYNSYLLARDLASRTLVDLRQGRAFVA